MKSADNRTKRKALVEAFFYRELVSHSRITMLPHGSFLAGQRYTRPRWHAHMYTRKDKDTKASEMCTHYTPATRQDKYVWLCVFFLRCILSAVVWSGRTPCLTPLCLWIIILPFTHQSISFVSLPCRSVSQPASHCALHSLSQRISAWEAEPISRSQMDVSLTATLLCLKVKHKKRTTGISMVHHTRHSKHLSFPCYHSMHLHISTSTFLMHQHLYNITHVHSLVGEGPKRCSQPSDWPPAKMYAKRDSFAHRGAECTNKTCTCTLIHTQIQPHTDSPEGRSPRDRPAACASSGRPVIKSGIHEWKWIQLSTRIYSKANLIRVIHMLIHMLTARFLQGTSWLFSPLQTAGTRTGKRLHFHLSICTSKPPIRVTRCGL